jgi:hypothetical protein
VLGAAVGDDVTVSVVPGGAAPAETESVVPSTETVAPMALTVAAEVAPVPTGF